ncbi:MAG TPA: selenoneine biosynthesis selenosugar synthase SenB [Candidatus Eisenbacteria bacterium]|nr:selenoneine biosynthesis selenosugar synthase SenB [Candidatus Eisenbacteria bacterium]
MNLRIVTPAPLSFRNGNNITALRWTRLLRRLGHKVTIAQSYDTGRCDLLIALHARRSYPSIRRFHELRPGAPLVVVLTGTDLYRDLRVSRAARHSLQLATRIVVLQAMALRKLPGPLHGKTRVIYQSAERVTPKTPPQWDARPFRICVVGHLRSEKDPLRAAFAARRLRADSRVQIVQVGRALDHRLAARAREEMKRNPRYRWIGELPHAQTRRLLAASHVSLITSRIEGSSNVLSESIASSVPVIASKISGLIGTLGNDYPGYFPPGDTEKLAALLDKAERDRGFYRALQRACARLKGLIDPGREARAWRSLLGELRASARRT